MNLAELRTTLTEWLSELEPWYGIPEQGPENYILTDEEFARYRYSRVSMGKREADPNTLHVVLFTEQTAYHFSARFDGRTYLGCVAEARHYRPGETWTRGNDLPDGIFCRATWNNILRGILRYELQAMTQEAINVIKDIPPKTIAESVAV